MNITEANQIPRAADRGSVPALPEQGSPRSLLDDLSIGVFRIARSGRFLEANTALATMLGYESAEQLLASAGEALAPTAGPDARELLARLDAEGEIRGVETTFRSRLGASLPVRVNARAVRYPAAPSPGGAPTLYYEGTMEVISPRDGAEQKLKERTACLHALIETSPLGIVVLTPSGTVELCNRVFTSIFGYRQREILGRELDAILAPDEAFEEARRFSAELFSGQAARAVTRRRRQDGAWVDVELIGAPLVADGRPLGALGIYQDLTERRAQEQALGESQAFLQQALDSLTAHVAILDARGGIIAANAAWNCFAREIGVPAACSHRNYLESCDKAAATGIQEAGAAAEAIRRVIAGSREPQELEYTCDAPGERRWFQLRVSRFAGPGPVRIFVSHEDVTARKSLEQELSQAQKMDAVGRLAGGVAHDFNNLLMVVSGYSELLVDQFAPGHPGRHHAEEIKRAAARATSLTRQLLTFSHKQILDPQVLRLDGVIGEMQQLLRRLIPENVEIVCRLEAAACEVRADPAQIEQVIMNLGATAADAMPSGGRLEIGTRAVTLDEAFCRLQPDLAPGPYVELSVADTGCGMDAVLRSRAFEPFFTTKAQGRGLGLGLAAVYGVAKQSRGHITVESDPGRGTRFRLYFPCIQAAAEQPPQSGHLVGAAPESVTVLLVEDEDSVREMTEAFLAGQGYRVLTAHDGPQALRIARLHPGPVHLLITDVVMPGMSGPDLAGQIRQIRPEVQVLFASGYAEDAVLNGAAAELKGRFLQKPFELRKLAEVVRSMLQGEPVHAAGL